MTPFKSAIAFTLLATFVVFPWARAQNSNRIDTAFQKFWSAKSPDDAAHVTDDLLKSGLAFDEAYRRLKAGRTYTAQKTGIVILSNKTNGVEHFYALNVP